MNKTYITTMPDHAGAFLQASRIIASAGGNITRVSYNKAVDTHTLFLDVAGSAEQLAIISAGLEQLGYIHDGDDGRRVLLLSFLLVDEPGALLPVLELIRRYDFNISYINSQSNGQGYQDFRMGLFIENPQDIRRFLNEATRLCEAHIIDYDESERVLDNTVFYMGFASRMAKKLRLSPAQAREVMAQSNLIMQMLDARSEPPYKTFDYIARFADMLVKYKGDAFEPRVTRIDLRDDLELTCIEPPCGSNTYILKRGGALLFIDSGFACYAQEMYKLFLQLYPDFEHMPRRFIPTHPDMDHCGLSNLFDEIIVSREGWAHFDRENRRAPNFREENPNHAPYVSISRILTRYLPPRPESLRIVEGAPDDGKPLCYIGSVDFQGVTLALYRGNGGHAPGEIAIVDEADRLVFSGDIMVNIDGFTPPQAAFNRLAPYLMTSVNMDSRKAIQERVYLKKMFSPSEYRYCCGHGAIMEPKS